MKKGIVIFNKTGGYSGYIGNRMFQAAATIGIAIKNCMDYKFPHCEYYEYFKGLIPTQKDLHFTITEEYREPNYHYNEVIFNTEKNYNIICPDFGFQSKKYWQHCEKLIKETFIFRHDIINYINKKYGEELFSPYYGLCSIHVRRGDFLNWPNQHPVLPMDYYLQAAQKIECGNKNIKYVVFSNDIKWCKENFLQHEIFKDKITFAEGNSGPQDMYFMSRCPINIMANSSFSWWAQELNYYEDKTVFAPAKNKYYGIMYSHWNLDDLYNDNWILI